MSLRARHNFREELRAQHGIPSGKSLKGINEGFGFRESWLDAFIERIGERFDEARRAAVQQAPEGTSVALMRLDGALLKTRKYIDDKFSGRRGASPLSSLGRTNAAGVAAGRAAANAVTLGRKGVTGGSTGRKGLLGK